MNINYKIVQLDIRNNNIIEYDNNLLWSIKEELQYFKNKTRY